MASQAVVWTTEETDKLIDIIKKYPVLWKTDHQHYGRQKASMNDESTVFDCIEGDSRDSKLNLH